ncbi:ATP-binding cassette domain-containing protein [Candidatus Woesearchaeota archaeon]|nr:ATP-binding cassette domain-containing protein [Candidatus Woesearchaeota archaeon]
MVKKEEIIVVKDLVKNYKTESVVTKVLKAISFKIYKGEFVGIMGPSGSGKSTTLHQLALLDQPTSGSVNIKGKEVTKLNEKELAFFRLNHLGYVFQQYRILPELTSLENVFIPRKATGENRKIYINKAKELLTRVGLSHRYNHKPSELSGGEQQRVAIARALINNPDILFADEPTANLDTLSSEQIMQLFKELNKKSNQTIVMVSHDPEQIKYFDRVIKLIDGKIKDEKSYNKITSK